MNETQLLMSIRDALLATGRVLLWRCNSGRMRDNTGRWVQFGLGLGCPDLVGMLRECHGPCHAGEPCRCAGRFLAIEVKLPGKSPEPHQEAWHRAARAAGACVIVAHSVEEALDGLP